MSYVNQAVIFLALTAFATCIAALAVCYVDGTCSNKNGKLRILSILALVAAICSAIAGLRSDSEFLCIAAISGWISLLLEIAARKLKFLRRGPTFDQPLPPCKPCRLRNIECRHR